ncbi:uncharacterized protein N7477_008152 [Penicillium maclennaniae]|uniref:uncharacterized protein n=1 Tax=Penicillium maclennaniae TaxID=1343394 RepID=UPI00253FE799|nr:uncharacterized protein N7477_008152 [Penicillium maclennaniae]KAJ5665704.1 hypothetical protein N7477_008152 [Penicillium maclennaniae]
MDSDSVRSGKKRVPQDEDAVSSSLEVDSQSLKKQHISSNVPAWEAPVYEAPAWDESWVTGKAPLSSSSGGYGRSIIAEEAPLSPWISEGNIMPAKVPKDDGAFMKHFSSDGQSPLSFAALKGDFKTVKLLLDAGVVANEEERYIISTLLARAVDYGDSEAPWLLADGRSNVSLRLRVGSFGSPLALACALWSPGTTTTVEILLEAGADIDMQLTSGEYGSALAAACAAGRFLEDMPHGSALAAACADWSPKMTKNFIEFLLEAGADVDMQLLSGEFGSALAAACAAGRLSNVKLLLQRGADIKLQLKSGRYGSALAAACSAGQVSAVEFLLKKGAHVNAQLSSGIYGSALAAACLSVSPGNTDVIDILMEAGADIDLQLTSGEHGSALAAACAARSGSMVKYMLDKGANINLQLTSGRYGSALANALARERLDHVGLLLSRGADASLPLLIGEFGDAMALAFDSENLDTIELLLQAGASIGPLAEALIRQPPQSGTHFVKNFEAMGMNSNTFEARYLRQTFLWYPPTTMSAIQDKSTWLFDFGALIRTEYTVEFDALGHLIERFYGEMGLRVLQGLVHAISHHGQYSKLLGVHLRAVLNLFFYSRWIHEAQGLANES